MALRSPEEHSRPERDLSAACDRASALVSPKGLLVTAIDLELLPEQALTRRWLRRPAAPLVAWQWLAGRTTELHCAASSVPPQLLTSLWALGEPLAAYSNQHERASLDHTLKLTAAIFSFCHSQSRGPALACQERMLAACLLPLYRGLARGTVSEVTSVMRRQLADALTLTLLIQEFRDDLAGVLSTAMTTDQTPYTVLNGAINIELELLTQRMLTTAQKWDGRDVDDLDAHVSTDVLVDSRPAWGAAQVLWRLAGELIADRAEFVVPRDWISVPVPWNEASEHWRSIASALGKVSTGALDDLLTLKKATVPTSVESSSDNNTAPARQPDVEAPAAAKAKEKVDGIDEITRLKLEIEIANSVESLVNASRSAIKRRPSNDSPEVDKKLARRGKVPEEFAIPKIIIAEVRSHSDPAFVAVVRRQLSICRSDQRMLSLLAIEVRPDVDEESLPTISSRLHSWQQKLVNWMADHPDVHDPYAFVSNEGELILCLMDIERNTATNLLRHGLIEILTGQTVPVDLTAMISRAAIAAHYHSGIASVSSPTAGFEPEQLVEATYRCLAAAQRHGKASIKSIEVF